MIFFSKECTNTGNRKLLKHIIFDFDGTLADSSEIGFQIINDLSEKYKIKKFTKEELMAINRMPIKDRLKLVGIPLYRIPQLLIEGLARYRVLINDLKTFDGIQELLTELKNQGFTLSVISSNNVENIEYFLDKYKLKYFDNVISANSIFGKHIAIKKYLKKFNLGINEIIYVGDEIRDIEACKVLNVKVIAVTWGFDAIELIKSGNPDYIANKPEDILEIIQI